MKPRVILFLFYKYDIVDFSLFPDATAKMRNIYYTYKQLSKKSINIFLWFKCILSFYGYMIRESIFNLYNFCKYVCMCVLDLN